MEGTLSIDELLQHSSWVRELARSLVADQATADDLAQEAMLVALRKPPAPGVALRPWLAGVLRNVRASWRRREARRANREALVEPAGEAASTEELVSQVEVERRLAKAVLALSEPYRRTVLLRYFRGLSSAEIARRTGTPEGTVRWRLKRGLDRLREDMDADYGGRRAWVALLLPALDAETPVAAGGATGAWLALVGWARALAAPLAFVLAGLGAWLVLFLVRDSPRDPAESPALAPSPVDAERVARGSPTGTESTRVADARARASAAELAAPVDALVELRARAVDAEGEPLAGAALALGPAESERSGKDGELVLVLPARELTSPRLVEIVASAAGRVPARVEARHRAGPVLWLGELELTRGAALAGRVLDEEGEPAVGATVLVETLPEVPELRGISLELRAPFGSRLPEGVPRTLTGADGRFRFDALAPCHARVWARTEGGFAAHSEVLALAPGTESACPELALPPMGEDAWIEGRVVDPEGEPVAGARVEALRREIASELFADHAAVFSTSSDERGRFRLAVNPRPELAVSARDGEGRFGDAPAVHAAGGARGLELALAPLRTFELLAVDAEGNLLEGFETSVHRAADGLRLAAHSRSPITVAPARVPLPADPFVLRVGGPGFERVELGPFAPEDVGETVRCTLERAPALRGRVLRAGRPVAGARVLVLRPFAEGTPPWRALEGVATGAEPFACAFASSDAEGECDLEGRFALDGPPPARFWLRVEPPGLGSSVHGPFDAPEEPELEPEIDLELELELPEPGAIEGVVLAPRGKSAAGTLVGATGGDGRIEVARVGPDGLFRFEGLAPGAWQVRALARDLTADEERRLLLAGGERRDRAPPADAIVVAGESARAVVDLRATAETRLSGRLLFDGRPPGPWRVELEPAGAVGEARVAVTSLDVEGRFEASLPAPGLYVLRASSEDAKGTLARVEDRVSVQRGGARWDVSLETGALALRGAPGEDVSGGQFSYVWEGPGELRFAARVDRDGQGGGRELRVPAGRGRVIARRVDHVDRPSPTVLEVEIEPGGSVSPVLPPGAALLR